MASDWVLVVLGSGKWLGACGVGQWQVIGCFWCWAVASGWVLVVLGSDKWLGSCGVG